MSRRWVWGLAVLAGLAAQPAVAQEQPERVHLHGFGSWNYGRTDGNEYLGAEEDGSYDSASFALNAVGEVSSKLRVVGQLEWRDEEEPNEIEFDYAFAEWTFSSGLKLRAGKVKQPFGISAEVFDVGTLRPFLQLPQAVYGKAGLVGENYKGVGLTGSFEGRGGWGLNYDVYGGGQELEEFAPPEAVLLGEEFDEPEELERTRDMLGARAVVQTPLRGLTFGGSGYIGHEIGSARRHGLGAQVEYLDGPWSLRSEFVHETVQDDEKADGFYAEAAYRLGAHWQLAGQYGHFKAEFAGPAVVDAPSLLEHEEWVAGLNYWWSPSFVMKASYHHVDGNRFAVPPLDTLAEAAAAGTLEPRTSAFLAGVQFSF